jgi:hypothetical protein
VSSTAGGNGKLPGRRPRRLRADDVIPLPKRPYRDSVIFYGVLSALIVGIAWLTGGRIVPGELLRDPGDGPPQVGALLVAIAFFVVATTWSWWRFRRALVLRRAKR